MTLLELMLLALAVFSFLFGVGYSTMSITKSVDAG